MTNNKYFKLFTFAVLLFFSGYIYANFYRPPEISRVEFTGNTIEIDMRVLKDKWKFEPGEIRARPGDKVRIKIYNEDDYDHGFSLDVFGINRRLFPKKITVIDFIASNEGKFNFYCSVPCGEGHYEQIGFLIVG